MTWPLIVLASIWLDVVVPFAPWIAVVLFFILSKEVTDVSSEERK